MHFDKLLGLVLLSLAHSFDVVNIDNFRVSSDNLANLLESISSERNDIAFHLIEASDQLPNIANHLDLSQSRVENVLELIHSARESEGARINDDAIWADLNELAAWQADSSFLLQSIVSYFDLLRKKLNTMSILIEKFSSNLHDVDVNLAVQLVETHRNNSNSVRWWKENFNSDEYRTNLNSKVSSTLQRLYYEANLLNTTTPSLEVDMFQQSEGIINTDSDNQERKEERAILGHESYPGMASLQMGDDLPAEPTCSCACDTFNVSFVELVVREVVNEEISAAIDTIQVITNSVTAVDDAFMRQLCGAAPVPLPCDPCPDCNVSVSNVPLNCSCDNDPTKTVRLDAVEVEDVEDVPVSTAPIAHDIEEMEYNHMEENEDDDVVDLRAIAAAAPRPCHPPLTVLEEQSAATYWPESFFFTISLFSVWKSCEKLLGLHHLPFYTTVSLSKWLQHHSQRYSIHLPVQKTLFQLLKLKVAGVGNHSLAVDGNLSLGSCWPLQGSAGNVTVELNYEIVMTHVSIGHVSRENAVDISTAPKEFEIYGSTHRYGHYRYLGQGVYDINSDEVVQHFSVLESPLVKFVTLKVINNYGSSLYTCIYDVKVSGYAEM